MNDQEMKDLELLREELVQLGDQASVTKGFITEISEHLNSALQLVDLLQGKPQLRPTPEG